MGQWGIQTENQYLQCDVVSVLIEDLVQEAPAHTHLRPSLFPAPTPQRLG